jgi:hypothetical protein
VNRAWHRLAAGSGIAPTARSPVLMLAAAAVIAGAACRGVGPPGGTGGMSNRRMSVSDGGGPDGGAAGYAAGVGGAGGSCHGDQAAWARITSAPMACSKNSDCCVVVNACLSRAQVVRASDSASAAAAWFYCEPCNDCIAKMVDVGCVAGACVGQVAPNSGGRNGTSHCGDDAIPFAPSKPAPSFDCP